MVNHRSPKAGLPVRSRPPLQMSNVQIKTADGFQLDAEYNEMNPEKIIIFAHGMTVDRNDEGIFVRAAKKLAESNFSTLLFDFRAHGKSEGDSVEDFRLSGEVKDLEAIINWVKEKDYKWIGLAGASFGGSISSLFVGKHPEAVGKLLLANPVLNYQNCFLEPNTEWGRENFSNWQERIKETGFIEVGSHKYKIGPKFFEELSHYSPGESLKLYTGPLLIIHGDKDSYVSYDDAKHCFETLQNPNKKFVTIEGSGHGFDEEPHETDVTGEIVEFFCSERSPIV